MKIGNDLIEAYKGYYEKESILPWTNAEAGYVLMGPDAAIDKWVREKIESDSPKERLAIYLEWNGILGYTNRIWELSQGEL